MKHVVVPDSAGITAFTLAAFQIVRLSKARRCRIVCRSGILLVTVSGEYRDFEVRPGGTLVVPNDGLALIEAIGDSRLLLQEPLRVDIRGRAFDLTSIGKHLRSVQASSLYRLDSTHGQFCDSALDY